MGIKTMAINKVKNMGIDGVSSFALNSYYGIKDFQDARQQGDSVGKSAVKAATSFALGELLGLWYPGFMLASGAPTMIAETGKHTARTMSAAYNQRGKLGSGYFNMSQAGYTMRQRSLNAIRQNGMNINSALGNEARTYFRGSGY